MIIWRSCGYRVPEIGPLKSITKLRIANMHTAAYKIIVLKDGGIDNPLNCGFTINDISTSIKDLTVRKYES